MTRPSPQLQQYEVVQGVRFPRTMQSVFCDILDGGEPGVALFEYDMKVTGRFMASRHATPAQRHIVSTLLLGYLAVEDSYSIDHDSVKGALNTYADSRHVPQTEKNELFDRLDVMMRSGENDTARRNAIDIAVHRLTYSNDPLDQRFRMADGLIQSFKDRNPDIRHHAADQAGSVMAQAVHVGQPLWMLDEIDAHASKMDMGVGNDSAALAALKNLAESTKAFVNHWQMRRFYTRLSDYQGEALHISKRMGERNEHAVMVTPAHDADKAVGVVRDMAHELALPYDMPLRLVNSYGDDNRWYMHDYAEFFGITDQVAAIDRAYRPPAQNTVPGTLHYR